MNNGILNHHFLIVLTVVLFAACNSDHGIPPLESTVENLLFDKDWIKQSNPDRIIRFNSDGTLTGSGGETLQWVWVKQDSEPCIITFNPISEYIEISNLDENSLNLRASLIGPPNDEFEWIDMGVWISE